ncbi:metallophosphoesterase [Bacteriovoracales bacterium]|nr:metallophosphoesterase [Bacteriovoracales bacterium]
MKTTVFFFLISFCYSSFSKLPHLRVIWHKSPDKEAIVTWSGKKLSRNQTFQLSSKENGKIVSRTITTRHKKVFGTRHWFHYVKLQNLKPLSKYSFSISTNGVKSQSYYFVTAPPKGKNFKLLFGGDSRSDRKKRMEINQSLANYIEKNPSVLALVHGGDFISNGLSWKQWQAWLEDYQLTITKDNRVLPLIVTRGNHEIGSKLFNKIFFWPGNQIFGNFYVTKFSNLSLITLNTNISHAGIQKRWLKKTLQEESKTQKWLIANYHRPAFPAVKKPGRSRKHWVPLFEKYQLDLAFESDGHTLKKTVPIYQGKRNDKLGVTYIGEGGLGVPQRVPKQKNKWYFKSPGYAKSAYHFIALEVGSDKMEVKVISPKDHSVLDKFSLKPRKR